MIRIDHLNKRQVELMNRIWNTKGEDDFAEWYCTLTEQDQKTVESLFIVLTYELYERLVLSSDLKESKTLLSKFTKKI